MWCAYLNQEEKNIKFKVITKLNLVSDCDKGD